MMMISNCNKNHIHSINLETAATDVVATRCTAILKFESKGLAMRIFTLASMTSGASRRISGVECRDIRIAVDQVRSQLRGIMTRHTLGDFRGVVVASRRRFHRDITRWVGQVLVEGDRDRRPRSRTGMTRRARLNGGDEEVTLYCRRADRLPRNNVSGITTVIFDIAVVTGLARYRRDHRMIHGRVREGATRVLVAAVAINFSARHNDRNVPQRIRIVGDVDHARGARRMATRRRTAGRHARVIEARGRGKRSRDVARAAIRIGHHVRWCFAKRTGDVAGVARRT